MKVKLTGQDRPGDGSAIVQRVDCCTQPFKNVEFRTTSVIPDGQPLGVEFWSWNVCRDGNGTEVKCNRAGEALNYTKGSFVRTRLPTNEPHALPFGPSFDASYYNHSNLNDPENNTLFVRPGDTTYFVPNPYAAFMAQGPGRQDMWSVSAQGGVYDTDWFWPMLLHVNASDPLGMT